MSKTKVEVMEIAKNHGLILKEDTLVFNESGLDFLAVFAADDQGKHWVLRIPRREDVMPRTRVEKQALDLVNKYCNSFQAPNWSIYTDEIIAYEKLDGVPAGTIDHEIGNYVWELDINNVPDQFYHTLGKVLAELHGIPKDQVIEAGLVVRTSEEIRQSMKERMDAVKSNYGVGQSLWNRWQSWLSNDELWPKETGFIHGDIHAGHILIDKNARVTGLIDWTEAKIEDVSNDFVFHYKAFGEEVLETLINCYKDAGGYYWPRMKEHIIELASAYPIAIAEFAIISGASKYEEMAKQALEINDI